MLQWSTQNEGEDPSTLKPVHICTSAIGGESVNSGQKCCSHNGYWAAGLGRNCLLTQPKKKVPIPLRLQVQRCKCQNCRLRERRQLHPVAQRASLNKQTSFLAVGGCSMGWQWRWKKHSVLAEVVPPSKSRFVEHTYHISYIYGDTLVISCNINCIASSYSILFRDSIKISR